MCVCAWACVCWELCCKGALLPHSSHFCSDLLDKDTHAPPGCGTSQPAGLWSFSELRFPSLPSCTLRVQWWYCVSLSTQIASACRGVHTCDLLQASQLSWEGCRPKCFPLSQMGKLRLSSSM